MRRRHAHATRRRTYDANPSNAISWLQHWFVIFVGVDDEKVLEDFFAGIVESVDAHLNTIRWNGPVGAQGRRVVEGVSIEKISRNVFILENIKESSVWKQLELLNEYTRDGHWSQIGNIVVAEAPFDASLIQETRICGEVGVVACLGEVDCELEPQRRTRKGQPLSHLERI